MKIRAIVRATKGVLAAGDPSRDIDLRRIASDTRTFRRGDVFLAISGKNFDGNAFTEEAFRKGASGAIVTRACAVPPGTFLIIVRDAVKALQDIASCHRSRFSLPVIAVTGSNGKTTVKEMIAAVLSPRYTVLRNEGTKNNHIGVPQTLLRLTREHTACVLELGTNHHGEIRALARIVRPTVAVITNIGPSHLEFLKDLAGVAREKKQICSSFDRRARPVAVVNGDDPFLATMRGGRYTVRTFGFGAGNDIRGRIVYRKRSRGSAMTRFSVNEKMTFETGLLGDHAVGNALAAIAVGLHCRVAPAAMRRALLRFRPAAMRLDLARVRGFRVINDSYNSNPLSMARALDVVREFPASARWVVSADMLELGGRGRGFHRDIGLLAARSGIDGLITYGALSRHTLAGARAGGMPDGALWHCASHDEIVRLLKKFVRAGDVVLLKGSRSMRMEEVLKKMRGRT